VGYTSVFFRTLNRRSLRYFRNSDRTMGTNDMYKVTVLGCVYAKSSKAINETRIYYLRLPDHKAIHQWFMDLCNEERGYEDFTPCILDDYKEVPDDAQSKA